MCTGLRSCLAAGSGVIFSTSLLYLVVRGWLAGDHFSMIVKREGAQCTGAAQEFQPHATAEIFVVFVTSLEPWVPIN